MGAASPGGVSPSLAWPESGRRYGGGSEPSPRPGGCHRRGASPKVSPSGCLVGFMRRSRRCTRTPRPRWTIPCWPSASSSVSTPTGPMSSTATRLLRTPRVWGGGGAFGCVSPLSPRESRAVTGSGWRSWGMDQGAGKRVKERGNGWRSRRTGGGAGCGLPRDGKGLIRLIAPQNLINPPPGPPSLPPTALHSGFKEVERELPGAEDLDGAARALMRLQDVYALSVKGMANGVFQRAGASCPPLYSPGRRVSLSADDCFHVGKVAYDTGDYYHSIAWLEEAVGLFRLSYGSWNPEDRSSLEDALDHLAFSYFMAGNISHALSLSREFLHYDPSNQRVVRNVAKYEKLLEMGTAASARPLQRPNSTRLQSRDAYEELCQRPGGQLAPEHLLRLSCSYETNGSPYLFLQPAKKEVVWIQPYVALYHDFISDAEAETIKGLAGPRLQRSVVASGEKQQKAEYRISKSAWLKDTADPVVRALEQRIAAVTGLDLRPPYAEYLQVVNYGLGGHYEPHFDHATLSAVEAGGSTAFVYANFSVPVVKNAALFWWNLRRNGDGDGDTLHAGCPVLAGDKWVANKWIHEHGQEFRRPCGADPQD
uniref:procollagen-proline 4-dioxygenase n=1 Tax=Falco tinnunculus TaxID=100819 RepID=A0A8C4V171_FALTI